MGFFCIRLYPLDVAAAEKNDDRFGRDHGNDFNNARRETRATSDRNLSGRAFARPLQADAILTIANESKSFSSAPQRFPILPVHRVPGYR